MAYSSLVLWLVALLCVCRVSSTFVRIDDEDNQTPLYTPSSYYHNPTNTTCAVKEGVSDAAILGALEWACEYGGVDCSPIQPGGSHFYPNTTVAHGNWVFNTYFWMDGHNTNTESCDFGGIAELTCGPTNWERIRGVNLGGWLVLEPWIVPSIFSQFLNLPPNQTAVDEYSFCEILGTAECTKQLQAHWQSWVTEEDFAAIWGMGLNAVRIPIGYWIFGNVAPFAPGGIDMLDWAMETAAFYNISVLIDLHGAPGSQNGFDNSGRACGQCAGICPSNFTWDTEQSNIDFTVNTLQKLAQRYQNATNLLGIEFLNEPNWVLDLNTLKTFYKAAYGAIRAVAPNVHVWFHDSFRYNAWTDFMTEEQGYTGVHIDTHIYQAFSQQDQQQTTEGHLMEACGYQRQVNYMQCLEQPVIVGEWSLGTTTCPEWLLGFEKPPTAPLYNVSCPHNMTDAWLTQYAQTQINSWEHGHGWFFWNFKTESEPYWSWFEGVARGWLPANARNLPSSLSSACDGLDPVELRTFSPPKNFKAKDKAVTN